MAEPAILFADAEALVIAYLADAVDVDAYGQVPTGLDPASFDSFLVVRRIGGVRRAKVVDAADLTVYAYAAREDDASDLAQLARAHLGAMAGTTLGDDAVPCYRVDEVGGPVPLPDPLTDLPRYTQTVTVHLRGSALT